MSFQRDQWAIEWQRLRELDWRGLDVKEAGNWPWLLKVLSCGVTLLATLGVMLWLTIGERRDAFMASQRQEVRLLSEYRSRVSGAAFLPERRDQLAALETQVARFHTMLPSDAEIPSLLDSISDAAADNRLIIDTVWLRPALEQPHYIQQPLDIQVRGGYHQLARFIADIASLPRMVTQHDFTLAPVEGHGDMLQLSLLARTYRYTEDSDQPLDEGAGVP